MNRSLGGMSFYLLFTSCLIATLNCCMANDSMAESLPLKLQTLHSGHPEVIHIGDKIALSFQPPDGSPGAMMVRGVVREMTAYEIVFLDRRVRRTDIIPQSSFLIEREPASRFLNYSLYGRLKTLASLQARHKGDQSLPSSIAEILDPGLIVEEKYIPRMAYILLLASTHSSQKLVERIFLMGRVLTEGASRSLEAYFGFNWAKVFTDEQVKTRLGLLAADDPPFEDEGRNPHPTVEKLVDLDFIGMLPRSLKYPILYRLSMHPNYNFAIAGIQAIFDELSRHFEILPLARIFLHGPPTRDRAELKRRLEQIRAHLAHQVQKEGDHEWKWLLEVLDAEDQHLLREAIPVYEESDAEIQEIAFQGFLWAANFETRFFLTHREGGKTRSALKYLSLGKWKTKSIRNIHYSWSQSRGQNLSTRDPLEYAHWKDFISIKPNPYGILLGEMQTMEGRGLAYHNLAERYALFESQLEVLFHKNLGRHLSTSFFSLLAFRTLELMGSQKAQELASSLTQTCGADVDEISWVPEMIILDYKTLSEDPAQWLIRKHAEARSSAEVELGFTALREEELRLSQLIRPWQRATERAMQCAPLVSLLAN